jgi:predicted trehalose synthase
MESDMSKKKPPVDNRTIEQKAEDELRRQQSEKKELQQKAKAMVRNDKREFMKQYVLHRALAVKDKTMPTPEAMTKTAAEAWEIIMAMQLTKLDWGDDVTYN